MLCARFGIIDSYVCNVFLTYSIIWLQKTCNIGHKPFSWRFLELGSINEIVSSGKDLRHSVSTSCFVFQRRNKIIRGCQKHGVSTWWQHFNFGINYSFKFFLFHKALIAFNVNLANLVGLCSQETKKWWNVYPECTVSRFGYKHLPNE